MSVITAALLCPPHSAAAPRLFNTIEFKANSLNALPLWQNALKRIRQDTPIINACHQNMNHCRNEQMVLWGRFIHEHYNDNNINNRLRAVNNFANRWPYKTDNDAWGYDDYWAAPKEFLGNSGDCEDYAIFKYQTFKRLGFNPHDMRIVVVRDTVRDYDHAVLAVYNKDEIYILDSLFNRPLPVDKVRQYRPYYSVNEFSRWMHVQPIRRRR